MKKKYICLLIFISFLMMRVILSFAMPAYNAAGVDRELRNIGHTYPELEIMRERVIFEFNEDVSCAGWEHMFNPQHIGDLRRASKQPGSVYYQHHDRLKISSKIEGRGNEWTSAWNGSGSYSDIQVKLPSSEGFEGKSIVLPVDTTNEIKQDRRVNFPRKTEFVEKLPNPDSLYVFIMAGQSNMAGRGFVEPQDTISNRKILTIDKSMNWIYAKEPLNFYEPSMAGLDCGMSFAGKLLDSVPEGIKVAVIPCAVGGSSIEQWLYNETHRGVKLLENFEEKVKFAEKYGRIKGILWHQGESNAKSELIPKYAQRLDSLIVSFRGIVKNDSLPVILGELGSYAEPEEKQVRWDSINSITHAVAKNKNVSVVVTNDLKDKGDKVHFGTESQRELGERYAKKYLELYIQ